MKYSFCLFFIALIYCQITGCKKDTIENRPGNPNTPAAPENTGPVSFAGEDIFVLMPGNFAKLNGSASDNENNIIEVRWSKISGPAFFTIENASALDTKVNNLEKGVYKFELTVTDRLNLVDKDTVVVTVGELSGGPNEIIFNNLVWISPWYNSVEIKNFVSTIPRGLLFKVFIQRDNDPIWHAVLSATDPSLPSNALYDYFVITRPHDFYSNGSLYISYYGHDVDDTPNVKIVF